MSMKYAEERHREAMVWADRGDLEQALYHEREAVRAWRVAGAAEPTMRVLQQSAASLAAEARGRAKLVEPGEYLELCPICDTVVSLDSTRHLNEHGHVMTGPCPGSGKMPKTGAVLLRLIVSNMNSTRESFNYRFTVAQLLQIYRMQLAGEWDFYPDQWDDRQVEEALAGTPPRWSDDEVPIYADGSSPKDGGTA